MSHSDARKASYTEPVADTWGSTPDADRQNEESTDCG